MKRKLAVRGDSPVNGPGRFSELIGRLQNIIRRARREALHSVDTLQVRACWEMGRHIVEFEQGGADRAQYGARLLSRIAERLTAGFGKGFDERNLRHMRAFFRIFPIWNALRSELSWTHYRLLLRVEDRRGREWYMNEAAQENWSSRALERQIDTLYYERLLSSKHRLPVRREAKRKTRKADKTPREFVRDPVLLEFLGMPDTGRLLETDLERALIGNLQQFLLELGKGFAFVARQQRVSTETRDYYVDLVFYNYKLRCFVLVDLKTGELNHQDIGQMDMYVRMYDELRRGPGDNPALGIILCARKDDSVVRFSILKEHKRLFASKYKLVLPSEAELRAELERERRLLSKERTRSDL